MSYAAKCWRENTEVLRAANYICYSPSYGQADEDAKVEHNITSIYLNSSQVKLGVKFGCAHCSELSGIGYSQLKHLTGCPFTSDLIDCHEEASMGDSDAEGNSLSCVLKAIPSMSKVITPPGQDTNEKMITAILLHFMMKIKLMTAILLQFMMSALWY
jgi:hypothetical protein